MLQPVENQQDGGAFWLAGCPYGERHTCLLDLVWHENNWASQLSLNPLLSPTWLHRRGWRAVGRSVLPKHQRCHVHRSVWSPPTFIPGDTTCPQESDDKARFKDVLWMSNEIKCSFFTGRRRRKRKRSWMRATLRLFTTGMQTVGCRVVLSTGLLDQTMTWLWASFIHTCCMNYVFNTAPPPP